MVGLELRGAKLGKVVGVLGVRLELEGSLGLGSVGLQGSLLFTVCQS